MKAVLYVTLIAQVFFVSGCGVYGDAHVYGAYCLVSAADLHAATRAVQKGAQPPNIYAYRVISCDHIRLFTTASESENGSYYDARRINGKWEWRGGIIKWNEPIVYH